MTEREFMELLNLYLDHEISAKDALRLEAEVQRNATRRAVYRDYCRMQKACQLLAADFAPAGGVRESSKADQTGLPFSNAQGRGRGWLVAGFGVAGTLAAACVALIVFFGRVSEKALDLSTRSAVPVGTAPDISRSALASGISGGANRGSETSVINQATLVSSSLALSLARSGENGLKVAQPGDQLEWVRNFQLVSMSERNRFEPLRFETVPATMRPELRPLQHTNQVEPAAEMTAFRFLK